MQLILAVGLDVLVAFVCAMLFCLLTLVSLWAEMSMESERAVDGASIACVILTILFVAYHYLANILAAWCGAL